MYVGVGWRWVWLDCVGLCWFRFIWAGLGSFGLGRVVLVWSGLGCVPFVCVGCGWVGCDGLSCVTGRNAAVWFCLGCVGLALVYSLGWVGRGLRPFG